jgi:pimeloyl-ACP methyl ester carboxylesterase
MKLTRSLIALGLALGVFVRAPAFATPEAPPVDPELLPYAKPDILAKLPDGRAIHLKCMGAGSPTVILTAGLGDWGEVWRKVQPSVATTTRACTWDRAGFGYSDGTLQTQTVDNTTSDLEAALRAAGVRGPYIMVGHSLGGYEDLLFTDRHRDAVAGMVLVDSAIPDQVARLAKAAPALMGALMALVPLDLKSLRSCAAAVKNGKVTLGSSDPDGCLAYTPGYPKETAAALAKLDTDETRWTARISLEENFPLSGRLAVNPARNYGAMPLIVLTAQKPQPLPGAPQTVVDAYRKGFPVFRGEWTRAHDELAALSSRGRNQLVSDSSHYIEIERPQVVIDAIDEVVAQSRRSIDTGE